MISINLIEEVMRLINMSQWREDMTVWLGQEDESRTKS